MIDTSLSHISLVFYNFTPHACVHLDQTQNPDKKVLLRERKRHTALRVVSASFPDGWGRGGTPSNLGWGGVPGNPLLILDGVPPSAEWGTPHPDLEWGYLPSRPGWGTPPLSGPEMGYPPPPSAEWGIPHPDLGWGTTPNLDLG